MDEFLKEAGYETLVRHIADENGEQCFLSNQDPEYLEYIGMSPIEKHNLQYTVNHKSLLFAVLNEVQARIIDYAKEKRREEQEIINRNYLTMNGYKKWRIQRYLWISQLTQEG